MANTAPAIGIDLGTTFSCIGVYRFGKVEIIANGFGNRLTPSMVAFDESERLIGDPAKQQQVNNVENTIFDAKRLLGRSYDDIMIQKDLVHYPFKIVNSDGKPKFQVKFEEKDTFFAPEEVSGMVLKGMKVIAEDYLGMKVKEAVITVPAYFNDLQRKATKDAADIAELKVLRIINEPTAAAMAYGFCNKQIASKKVFVFDLGGGTFDVSVLSIENMHFEVLATGGDTFLGGEDFDRCLVNHFTKEIESKHKKDVSKNKHVLGSLKIACEQAKKTLSYQAIAKILLPLLIDGVDFKATLSRSKFEDLNSDLFKKTMDAVKATLNEAGIDKKDIDEVVLVGGSTRIPKIQNMIKEFFGKEPTKTINPDEAVAMGACLCAAILQGYSSNEIVNAVLEDVTPLSLGVGTNLGHEQMSVLIKRNTKLPASQTSVFWPLNDNQKVIRFKIFQGESINSQENIFLGEFFLLEVPPGPKGKEKVEVTFHIDEDGLLNVKAVLLSTKMESKITISTRGNLTTNEIKAMINRAKKIDDEEKHRKDLILAKNDCEDFFIKIKEYFSTDNTSIKVPVPARLNITNKASEFLDWLDVFGSDDIEILENRKEKLRAICAPYLPLKFDQKS